MHGNEPQLETDDRFPSGPWVGYYQQWGVRSRQRLGLMFRDGRIAGEGRDPAGEFYVEGTYNLDSGHVLMAKAYTSHVVEYDAQASQDGIAGDWCIRYFGGIMSDGGVFQIWPDLLAMEEAARAEAEASTT